jgi:hypothetical protein
MTDMLYSSVRSAYKDAFIYSGEELLCVKACLVKLKKIIAKKKRKVLRKRSERRQTKGNAGGATGGSLPITSSVVVQTPTPQQPQQYQQQQQQPQQLQPLQPVIRRGAGKTPIGKRPAAMAGTTAATPMLIDDDDDDGAKATGTVVAAAALASTLVEDRKVGRSSNTAGLTALKKQKQAAAAAAADIKVATIRKTDVWNHDNRILPVGTRIAALADEHSKPRLWILASVLRYSPGLRSRYEVQDEDPGDRNNPQLLKKRYLLPPDKIIPLPLLSDVGINKRRTMLQNTRVIALYPIGQITVLYPAVVLQNPRKRKSTDYLLRFDDDDGAERVVSAEHVAPVPETWAKNMI